MRIFLSSCDHTICLTSAHLAMCAYEKMHAHCLLDLAWKYIHSPIINWMFPITQICIVSLKTVLISLNMSHTKKQRRFFFLIFSRLGKNNMFVVFSFLSATQVQMSISEAFKITYDMVDEHYKHGTSLPKTYTVYYNANYRKHCTEI
jgi:hypothetical protein